MAFTLYHMNICIFAKTVLKQAKPTGVKSISNFTKNDHGMSISQSNDELLQRESRKIKGTYLKRDKYHNVLVLSNENLMSKIFGSKFNILHTGGSENTLGDLHNMRSICRMASTISSKIYRKHKDSELEEFLNQTCCGLIEGEQYSSKIMQDSNKYESTELSEAEYEISSSLMDQIPTNFQEKMEKSNESKEPTNAEFKGCSSEPCTEYPTISNEPLTEFSVQRDIQKTIQVSIPELPGNYLFPSCGKNKTNFENRGVEYNDEKFIAGLTFLRYVQLNSTERKLKSGTNTINSTNSRNVGYITNSIYRYIDGLLIRKMLYYHMDMRNIFSCSILRDKRIPGFVPKYSIHSSSYYHGQDTIFSIPKANANRKANQYFLLKNYMIHYGVNVEHQHKKQQGIPRKTRRKLELSPLQLGANTNSYSSSSEKNACDDVVSSCRPPSQPESECPPTFQQCKDENKSFKPSPPQQTCVCPCDTGKKIPNPRDPCPKFTNPCPEVAKPCPKFTNPCPKRVSLWQRIRNYLKARPNCPSPGVIKRKKTIIRVQKMADKAGLGLYDPCDDPSKICEEVKRRCCLARKHSCSQKRYFHC